MKTYIKISLFVFYIFSVTGNNTTIEKPIVALVCTYNNEKYCRSNLESIAKQNYSNYRILIVDDCSSDQNVALIQQALQDFNLINRTTFIQNKDRRLAMHNLYTSIIQIPDESIVAIIDGDDMLYYPNVFSFLNEKYSTDDIWLTYGNAVTMSTKRRYSGSVPFTNTNVAMNNFRRVKHAAVTHLRTFYAWLFKEISLQDFFYEGSFFKMTYDVAMFMPMIEMAGKRHEFIDQILYLYNDLNPINDNKVNVELQKFIDSYVRKKRPYAPLQQSNCGKYTDLPNKSMFHVLIDDKLTGQSIDPSYFIKYLELTHLNILKLLPQDQLPQAAIEIAPQIYAYQACNQQLYDITENAILRKSKINNSSFIKRKISHSSNDVILLGIIP